jgi:putative CocE/NonD family hydrolase
MTVPARRPRSPLPLPSLPLLCLLLLLLGPLAPARAAAQQAPGLPSETPAQFTPTRDGFDHARREVMVPMRDGVRLHTVILVPAGARRAPILLTRTPYDADRLTSHANSAHLGPNLAGYDNAPDVIVEGGYIRVVQDVRGKYRSEGDYVMNRPLSGPQNPTPVDHATDTYDTIEWLVRNVPESNGRVGIIGISYNGFLPLMALVHPHPALKVSVPMNPMVDGWRGDDWFHNGAFRQQMMPYMYDQQATREGTLKWWSTHHDDYDAYLQAGSAGALARRRGLEQTGFWRKVVAHPAYDAFWQDQAVDRLLAAEPLRVPVLIVHSLWDQEDIYGAPAVYAALEPKDTGNDMVYLVMGPWHHGQAIGDGSTLGALRFHQDTARWFRQDVLRPFLDHYLQDAAPAMDVAPVTTFETGTNTWRRLPAWPAGCPSGCTIARRPLYLREGFAASFEAPPAGAAAADEFVADPSKPVPFRARPIRPVQAADGTWRQWLVDDQREASSRTDVLAYTTPALTAPVKISGQAMAHLVASTTGTDADWVVKLIDVYPEENAANPKLAGYQLPVGVEIFRGRYQKGFSTPAPLTPGKPLNYKFELPNVNHVFKPGHRIMVQVQSSLFPLYDRNPQTHVPNIFWAKPEDYKPATQTIVHAPGQASAVWLPVVTDGK